MVPAMRKRPDHRFRFDRELQELAPEALSPSKAPVSKMKHPTRSSASLFPLQRLLSTKALGV
jgi:hypothetical protein